MKTELPADGANQHPRAMRQRGVRILSILLALDVFVLGGLIALLLVNRLLNNQLNIYVPHSWAAADAILDLKDDLVPYYVAYGGTLLALILITVSAWVWLIAKSRLLRYGLVLLILILVAVIACMLISGSEGTPPPPPMTPTPTGWTPAATLGSSSPTVAISPTSGPSGTLVQVVASGFPPNTSVSVGAGPVNSQFSEGARGATDANGVFTVQVPVQGAPGMDLVFAVAAEGLAGVSCPDLFHITE